MINRSALLSDLQKLLKRLEADLLERSESADVPAVGETLRAEYEQARTAERTAQNYEDWRNDAITQAAAAWVLSAVFVRFLEDNQLIEPPRFSGPGDQLQRARDERELYFRTHPTETDREYLLAVFDELATLPGTREVFSEHNPLRELPQWLSGDAAGELLAFFQKIDANAGGLVHDFTDADWDTRFLGDLYQDLSEAARKKYALLQTPEFVEEFILDRTLEPALDEFGLDAPPVTDAQGTAVTPAGFRMIDPACGSGHFLLGTFPRLLDRWFRQQPGGKVRDLVQKTLDSIHGVDVNPYAIAIARFRLLLKAMQACDIKRLKDAPAFQLNLACGDSLYHGRQRQMMLGDDWADEAHYFRSEDDNLIRKILRESIYHVVVANPPYIAPNDEAANRVYRKLYKSCHKSYSLSVPFMERIFRLAIREQKENYSAGYTGQITANSFMKAEFGKRLIEVFFKSVTLSYVIDCSGAYIPGHSTPTVILIGKNRDNSGIPVRTVMGIQGDQETPVDPAAGPVWTSILDMIDFEGSESSYVNVQDLDQESLQKHPWTFGGGGATELFDFLESNCRERLKNRISEIGRTTHTGEDSAYVMEYSSIKRRGFLEYFSPMVDGDAVRDYTLLPNEVSIFPYNKNNGHSISFTEFPASLQNHFWLLRIVLKCRKDFGQLIEDRGIQWFEHSMFFPSRYVNTKSIAYAFVATHNHFVYDEGHKLFNRPAPSIKLWENSKQDEYDLLIGILNSSTACFWIKRVTQVKTQVTGMDSDSWRLRRQLNTTKLKDLPFPKSHKTEFARRLSKLGQLLVKNQPFNLLTIWNHTSTEPLRKLIDEKKNETLKIKYEMTFIQEELDWQTYKDFGLLEEDLNYNDNFILLKFAERAFEIYLANENTELDSFTWFKKHGSTPITEIPAHWPEDYKRLVERRIEVIETNKNIGLIEQPEYKRRWNTEPWETQVERALRNWLLDRLERYFDFDGRMNAEGTPTAEIDIQLISIAQLADIAGRDPQFLEVGAVYRDDSAFDVQRLIAELVHAEQVPLLPILRYKPPGLRKRAEWEQTWELQRREDAIDARTELPEDDPQYLTPQAAQDLKQAEVGDIPVPPKYKSSDFLSTGGVRYWALRGKLDVPKERWISFPHCEGPDGTPVIAWAGYDHLQLARAISAYFVEVQEQFGGRDDPRLIPLLACQIELLPWLKQWHHDLDPEFNQRMDEVFAGFITAEAKALEMTTEEIKNWQPPKKVSKAKRKAGK